MSEADDIYDAASRLPLPDAAYYLWTSRWRLDRLERPAPTKPGKKTDVRDPQALARSVQDAFDRVRAQRAAAQDGPTFERVKRAHPEADSAAVKAAVVAALKFDTDCVRRFAPSRADLAKDVSHAIELARRDNPGFQEETYERARRHLAEAMR